MTQDETDYEVRFSSHRATFEQQLQRDHQRHVNKSTRSINGLRSLKFSIRKLSERGFGMPKHHREPVH